MLQLFLRGQESLRLDKMHRAGVQNEIISSSNVGSHISQDIKFHLFIFCKLELIQSLLAVSGLTPANSMGSDSGFESSLNFTHF